VGTAITWHRRYLWAPGLYNLPRLLSLTVLLAALISLPNGAMPRMAALSFLLLAFAIRLARWDRIDLAHHGNAKLARFCASAAALLSLADTILGPSSPTPLLVAAAQCMMSAVLILAANGQALFLRRVLLACVSLVALWLLMLQLYAAESSIQYELKSDPISALLLLFLAASLFLYESRAGLIPVGLTNWLGLRQSLVLLTAALGIPILLGWVRMLLAQRFPLPDGLGTALHVLATIVALAPFIGAALFSARERYERQLASLREFQLAEQAYAQLLSQGSEFYFALGFDGTIHQANENARRHFPINPRHGHNPHFTAILTEDSAGKLASTGRNLLTNLSAQPLLNFRTRDGESMPLNVAAACRFANGQPEEILLVGRSLPLGLRASGSSERLVPPVN
jgi:hypothetical protein